MKPNTEPEDKARAGLTTGSGPGDAQGEPGRVVQGKETDRATLAAIARQAMIERDLEPDFPPAALQELAAIGGPADATDEVRDLRDRLWASIDNDDSRDLDQLTVAESLAGGRVRILVAVADVDALVRKGSALDGHASRNTTSVYTPAAIFPMLPEALSTDLTSLNEDQDRIAVVADMVFEADGSLAASDLYRARVRNHAKLAYRSVAAWLDGQGAAPPRIVEMPGLDENLRLQDSVAQRLVELRRRHGALSLETIEAKAVFSGDVLSDLELDPREPGDAVDRGLHDCGQRSDRDLPRLEEISFPAPGSAVSGTLGPHRAARGRVRGAAPRRAGRRGPRSLSRAATPGRTRRSSPTSRWPWSSSSAEGSMPSICPAASRPDTSGWR